jgi:hypothetical protein
MPGETILLTQVTAAREGPLGKNLPSLPGKVGARVHARECHSSSGIVTGSPAP